MKKITALKTILSISLFGALFSGYLSYQEIFKETTEEAGCNPIGAPGTVFGYPACVYGFFMYLLVALVSFLGLKKKKE
ncbi:MAG: hypothetical protein PHV43_00430 [Candidatus Colwellbacteria bacterium]|nr:hypothetical protein [Candidatus Colwellbacteria bacterium]